MKTQCDSDGLLSEHSALRELFALNHSPWRWSEGIEVGIANALALITFSLAGHLSLGLIASLGAFTALYGKAMPLRQRLRTLPLVATGFVAASALAVLCAANAWLTIACMIVVALLASKLVFRAGLGSPGPMQFVLVAGVSASLAAHARVSNTILGSIEIPILVAVGTISALVVVAARAAFSYVQSQKFERSVAVPQVPLSRVDAEQSTITARVVIAVATAGLLSALLRVDHEYWMVMVAGTVLQATHDCQYSAFRAVQRFLGTIVGVLFFGLIRLTDPQGVWLIGIVVLLQFAIEVVVARHYALALSFITPTALTIAAAAGTTAPESLVAERIVDTLLGAIIALIVLWTSEWITKRTGLRGQIE